MFDDCTDLDAMLLGAAGIGGEVAYAMECMGEQALDGIDVDGSACIRLCMCMCRRVRAGR